MPLTNEEIAAELLWRYVENLRAAEAEGRSAALSRAELEQLLVALETASAVPEALAHTAPEALRSAVRRRVEEACAQSRPAHTGSRRRPRWLAGDGPPVPAWMFRTVAGAVAALALALGTVDVWHHPSTTRQVAVTAPGVHEMDHHLAESLIPRLVSDRLPPQQEKDLMWHMLMCPRCFNHFEALRHPGQTADARAATVRLVSR